jgi:hypothetical protein
MEWGEDRSRFRSFSLFWPFVMGNGYDDITNLLPGVNVPMCLGYLFERIRPIDDGFQFPGLQEFFQMMKAQRSFVGRPEDYLLAANNPDPWNSNDL